MATFKKTTQTAVTITLSQEEALAVSAVLRTYNHSRMAFRSRTPSSAAHLKQEYQDIVENLGASMLPMFSNKEMESVWDYEAMRACRDD